MTVRKVVPEASERDVEGGAARPPSPSDEEEGVGLGCRTDIAPPSAPQGVGVEYPSRSESPKRLVAQGEFYAGGKVVHDGVV
jgi:hypothetical protein